MASSLAEAVAYVLQTCHSTTIIIETKNTKSTQMNLTKLTGQSLKLRSYNKTVNFLFRLNENLAHVHKNVYNQYQAYFST